MALVDSSAGGTRGEAGASLPTFASESVYCAPLDSRTFAEQPALSRTASKGHGRQARLRCDTAQLPARACYGPGGGEQSGRSANSATTRLAARRPAGDARASWPSSVKASLALLQGMRPSHPPARTRSRRDCLLSLQPAGSDGPLRGRMGDLPRPLLRIAVRRISLGRRRATKKRSSSAHPPVRVDPRGTLARSSSSSRRRKRGPARAERSPSTTNDDDRPSDLSCSCPRSARAPPPPLQLRPSSSRCSPSLPSSSPRRPSRALCRRPSLAPLPTFPRLARPPTSADELQSHLDTMASAKKLHRRRAHHLPNLFWRGEISSSSSGDGDGESSSSREAELSIPRFRFERPKRWEDVGASSVVPACCVESASPPELLADPRRPSPSSVSLPRRSGSGLLRGPTSKVRPPLALPSASAGEPTTPSSH